MINLLDYFEKIYLITSYHTKNRLKDTLPHLHENNIYPELFVAPFKYHFLYRKCNQGQEFPGKLSLNCAYEQLFQKCLIEQTKTALFIEDDVVLLNNWETAIQKNWLNSTEWYMLRDGPETQFIGMSYRAIQDYLNKYALDTYPVDMALNDLDTSGKELNKKFGTTGEFTRQKSLKHHNTKQQISSSIFVEEDINILTF